MTTMFTQPNKIVEKLKINEEVAEKYMNMLWVKEEGIEEGRKEGEFKVAIMSINTVKKMFLKDISICDIADILEQEENYIKEIADLLSKHPDLSSTEIAKILIEQTKMLV